MSDEIYRSQREKLLAINSTFDGLMPESCPESVVVPSIGPLQARMLLQECANNHASLVIVVGWGDGSLLRIMRRDPLLRQKEIVLFLLPGEESAFACSFQKPILEEISDPLVRMVRIKNAQIINEAISHTFGKHEDIPRLAGADIISTHPLSEAGEESRKILGPILERAMADRPQSYGNDIIDTFTGLHFGSLNARRILPAPGIDELRHIFGNTPMISVAGGPSVSDHIDRLRQLQNKVIIVAADSSVPGLLKHGIEPHFCAPIERLPATAELLKDVGNTRINFAGSCVVPKAAVDVFGDRIVGIYGGDRLYDWLLPENRLRVTTGSSTGVFSANIACAMGHGPVWLLGHDLCRRESASHWSGSDYSAKLWSQARSQSQCTNVLNGYEERLVPGNDGTFKASITWWDRFRSELALLAIEMQSAKRPLYNVNAFHRQGAVIEGTIPGDLPDPSTLPDLPPLVLPPRNVARYEQWRVRAKELGNDTKKYQKHISVLREDIQVMRRRPIAQWQWEGLQERLNLTAEVSEGNRMAFAYFLRSALHNHTAEMHWRRRTPSHARFKSVVLSSMDGLCHALANALETIGPMIEEISRDCES